MLRQVYRNDPKKTDFINPEAVKQLGLLQTLERGSYSTALILVPGPESEFVNSRGEADDFQVLYYEPPVPKQKEELDAKQRIVMDLVDASTEGISASEVGRKLGTSPANAWHYLEALRKKGWAVKMTRPPNGLRGGHGKRYIATSEETENLFEADNQKIYGEVRKDLPIHAHTSMNFKEIQLHGLAETIKLHGPLKHNLALVFVDLTNNPELSSNPILVVYYRETVVTAGLTSRQTEAYDTLVKRRYEGITTRELATAMKMADNAAYMMLEHLTHVGWAVKVKEGETRSPAIYAAVGWADQDIKQRL